MISDLFEIAVPAEAAAPRSGPGEIRLSPGVSRPSVLGDDVPAAFGGTDHLIGSRELGGQASGGNDASRPGDGVSRAIRRSAGRICPRPRRSHIRSAA